MFEEHHEEAERLLRSPGMGQIDSDQSEAETSFASKGVLAAEYSTALDLFTVVLVTDLRPLNSSRRIHGQFL
jgi:hypothetical protein